MKKTLFATAALALAAAVPASALVTGAIPGSAEFRNTWNIAQAYPCVPLAYTGKPGVSPPLTWCGGPATSTPLTEGAAPGILSLRRAGNFLDVNCFVVVPTFTGTPPTGTTTRFECNVQAYRLVKQVPGSFKCPDVYGLPHFNADGVLQPYQYFQFGTGVRTWWSLNFTQPGTVFILEVTSVCRLVNRQGDSPTGVINTIGDPQVKMDRWRWRVVVNNATLRQVIDLMHGPAISTLEVPCILGEDMYVALVNAWNRLNTASGTQNIANAIFDFEALIVANCLFVEVLNPLVAFPGPEQFGAPNIQPPGNLAQTVFFGQGSAVAGIIDTIEHPCCCKLLVDLEALAIINNIIGQTPTLPRSLYGL